MFNMIPFNNGERNLFDYLDEMERNFWDGSITDTKQFRCDIQDKGDSYLLEAELPGFERENIHIDQEGDTLTISASTDTSNEKKSEDGSYLRRERKVGSFSRSFDVSGIDTDQIQATYRNGVLSLNLPKKNAQLPNSRRIEIAGE